MNASTTTSAAVHSTPGVVPSQSIDRRLHDVADVRVGEGVEVRVVSSPRAPTCGARGLVKSGGGY